MYVGIKYDHMPTYIKSYFNRSFLDKIFTSRID